MENSLNYTYKHFIGYNWVIQEARKRVPASEMARGFWTLGRLWLDCNAIEGRKQARRGGLARLRLAVSPFRRMHAGVNFPVIPITIISFYPVCPV